MSPAAASPELDLELSESECRALLERFLAEATDALFAFEQTVLTLEQQSEDPALRLEALRRMHTLKGDAACVGLGGMSRFAHAVESMIELRDGRVRPLDGDRISLLLEATDHLRELARSAAEGRDQLGERQQTFLDELGLLGG